MNKLLGKLKKYPTRDLLPYIISNISDLVILKFSNCLFLVNCIWHGIKINYGYKIWGKFCFRRFPGSEITIGNNFYAVCIPGRYSFNIFPQSLMRTCSSTARIIIGDDVGLNSIAIFCRSKKITIGDGTLIGGNCQITDNDGHLLWPPHNRLLSPGLEFDKDVTIGRNVFIGLNVLILKGAVIGDNSVIAAGSVVKGHIPENCLAAGVPAKIIHNYE